MIACAVGRERLHHRSAPALPRRHTRTNAARTHTQRYRPNLYLLPALSGQQGDIASGTLSFAPLVKPTATTPVSLPVSLPGVLGTLVVTTTSRTLRVATGRLVLMAGGLSVDGDAYPGAVSLGAGDSVTW